jgi:hypothetical protein
MSTPRTRSPSKRHYMWPSITGGLQKFKIILNCLLDHGANIAATTRGEETPLHLVIRTWKENRQHASIIQLLVEKGADVDAQNANTLETRLHVIIRRQRPSIAIINYLLDHGANIEATTEGKTPLAQSAEGMMLGKRKRLSNTYLQGGQMSTPRKRSPSKRHYMWSSPTGSLR